MKYRFNLLPSFSLSSVWKASATQFPAFYSLIIGGTPVPQSILK